MFWSSSSSPQGAFHAAQPLGQIAVDGALARPPLAQRNRDVIFLGLASLACDRLLLTVRDSRGRSRGSRAATAATRSTMIRCASTMSLSETGISGASRSNAINRVRSVNRSAHSSTTARELRLPA